MNQPTKSRAVIVTGASSGIGREIVRALARREWQVLAVARRAERLEELHGEFPDHVVPFTADITADDAPAAVVAAAQAKLGGLDLLVNNAGTTWVGPFDEMPITALDEILQLNVRALVLLCREAVPLLEQSERAQIINVSSVAAHLPMETLAVYCASKAAVTMFSRVLAKELAPQKIRVNTLSPTGTDTEIFEKVGVAIDRQQLVPAAEMAQLVVTLVDLPAGVDIGEIIAEKRLQP